jgi:hypothetical protein
MACPAHRLNCGHGTCRGPYTRSPCQVAWPRLAQMHDPALATETLKTENTATALLEGHAPSWPCCESTCIVCRKGAVRATALLEGHAPSWPCCRGGRACPAHRLNCGHGTCRGPYTRSPCQVAWPRLAQMHVPALATETLKTENTATALMWMALSRPLSVVVHGRRGCCRCRQ